MTPDSRLTVRFLPRFPGGSFGYEEGAIGSSVRSYISGFLVKPVIGDRLRIMCRATDMPSGPYRIDVTYYLV